MIEHFTRAANRLARKLHDYPWYHRTSMEDVRHVIEVWAEYDGSVPAEIPEKWEGYRVVVNKVDDEHPCPFGSVKP